MGFPPANENFERAVRKLLLGMPYVQWLGLSFVHIAPGEVDFSMPLRGEITFDGKSVQAGPIGSLLDFAGGAAAFTLVPEHEMLATTDFTVKLVAPAIGERFIGRGRVVVRTRSKIISRADIFAVKSGAETMIATGLVSMRALSS
ncbi:MAG TPA: PaaI family thioesterase [Xanthobacteraceae bacterium]|nr:PaaI family thioesterase [Xanthobacteraceae bacterium]